MKPRRGEGEGLPDPLPVLPEPDPLDPDRRFDPYFRPEPYMRSPRPPPPSSPRRPPPPPPPPPPSRPSSSGPDPYDPVAFFEGPSLSGPEGPHEDEEGPFDHYTGEVARSKQLKIPPVLHVIASTSDRFQPRPKYEYRSPISPVGQSPPPPPPNRPPPPTPSPRKRPRYAPPPPPPPPRPPRTNSEERINYGFPPSPGFNDGDGGFRPEGVNFASRPSRVAPPPSLAIPEFKDFATPPPPRHHAPPSYESPTNRKPLGAVPASLAGPFVREYELTNLLCSFTLS